MASECYGCAVGWAAVVVAFLFSRRRLSQGRAVPRWFALMTIGFFVGMGLSLVAVQFVGEQLQPATRYFGTATGVRNAFRLGMGHMAPASEVAH